MDETVRTLRCLRVGPAAFAMAAATLCAGAQAQLLPDPTRPPAALQRGGDSTSGASNAAAAASAPQLQSILIARQSGGRHVAVIDGQTLRLGDNYKGAVLTRVTDTEVELRHGARRQVLTLYPATSTKSQETR